MFNLRFNQHEENNQQKCCVELEYQVYCQVLSAHSAEGWFLDVLDREQGSVSAPESWDKRRIRASLLRSLYSQAFQGPPKLGLATTQGDVRHCMCQRDQSRAPWLWALQRWLTTVQMSKNNIAVSLPNCSLPLQSCLYRGHLWRPCGRPVHISQCRCHSVSCFCSSLFLSPSHSCLSSLFWDSRIFVPLAPSSSCLFPPTTTL